MEDSTTTARKPRTPWTPQDDATVRLLASDGWTDAEIASHLHRDVKLIGKKRRDLCIPRGVTPELAAMMGRVNTRNRNARA
ncbi:MAG: hypothetical protein EPO10_30465 [Reyranella sp.]|uniref:hypothetical protein n=1 Tax=Reyranella sp. TaxID=1929291 RepID=UPI001222F728|nr:hypothetical protein [Reyranella sp.]TAJ96987.1 MAG: hypothetical protein EPO41_04660 [Reyranella sp.]TBR21068.1 MAG: hypothetical protein EPO10_30465 [Reyranella sp.]